MQFSRLLLGIRLEFLRVLGLGLSLRFCRLDARFSKSLRFRLVFRRFLRRLSRFGFRNLVHHFDLFLHGLLVLLNRTQSLSFSLGGGGGLFLSLCLRRLDVRCGDSLCLLRRALVLRLLGSLQGLVCLLRVRYDFIRRADRLRLLSRSFLGVGFHFLLHDRISLLFLHGLRSFRRRLSLLPQVRIRSGSLFCFSSRGLCTRLASRISLCHIRLGRLDVRFGDSLCLRRRLRGILVLRLQGSRRRLSLRFSRSFWRFGSSIFCFWRRRRRLRRDWFLCRRLARFYFRLRLVRFLRSRHRLPRLFFFQLCRACCNLGDFSRASLVRIVRGRHLLRLGGKIKRGMIKE